MRKNKVVVESFGQSNYGEKNVVLTIIISKFLGTFGRNRTIREMNPTSAGASEAFYEKFFGNGIPSQTSKVYNKTGNDVKKEVKEGLDEKTHATKNFNEVLRAYIESPDAGNMMFYKTFIGENNFSNIFPGCGSLSEDEAVAMYRRDGQILQIIFMKEDNSPSYTVFV